MPLFSGRKYIGHNISELKMDNLKSGKEKGANGKPRSLRQIIAISLSKAREVKK